MIGAMGGIGLVHHLAAQQVVEIVRRFSPAERADILAHAAELLAEQEPRRGGRRRDERPTCPERPLRCAEGSGDRAAVILDDDPFATGPTRPG